MFFIHQIVLNFYYICSMLLVNCGNMSYSIARKDENTDKCEKLAQEDRRSVSNYIEILVERAWKKKNEENK